MSDQIKGDSQPVTQAITRMLDEGSAGVLVTLIDLPQQEPGSLRVGSRLLARESGTRVGSLGAANLDAALARHALRFFAAREEAKSVKVDELSPDLKQFYGV